MKKYFFYLIFFLLFALSKDARSHQPEVKFILVFNGKHLELVGESDSIDLGKHTPAGQLQWNVKVENRSDLMLLISNVRGSCGFQVPSWPRSPIAPGNSALIQLRLDTSRRGTLHRNLTINANTHNSVTVIPLTAKIIQP